MATDQRLMLVGIVTRASDMDLSGRASLVQFLNRVREL